MKTTKTDSNPVGLQNLSKGNTEMHTGLYVSCEKSHLLIGVVKRILQQKFSTRAVSGPPLPSGNCEILLQAIHNPLIGVNFPASKDLLEIYFNMLKESRPNFVLEKQPEVINLEDEDNPRMSSDDTRNQSVITVDDSFDEIKFEKGIAKSSHVEVINLCEETERSSPCKNDKQNEGEAVGGIGFVRGSNISTDKDNFVEQRPARISPGCSDDIMIIDSVDKNISKFTSLESSSKSIQELRSGGLKRKRSVRVIEIEDDEVITLDNSFQEPQHNQTNSFLSSYQSFKNLTVTAKGHERTVLPSHSQSNLIDLHTSHNENDSSCSSKKTDSVFPQPLYPSLASIFTSYGPDIEKSGSQNISTTNTLPAKKPSKFSYKRPAHLVSPLVRNVLDSTTNKSSNFSRMSNIYNPNANLLEKRTGLRPIIIDGNNVGVSYGNGQFSVKGIQICINYFELRGHRHIKAFIPQYRRRRDCHDILEKMERQGTVVITPSRRIEGKTVAPYDDRYIVQYAAEVGGVIITTDNYRDLLKENPMWKETIDNRLLFFSWAGHLLMFPQDPMGRTGPSLDDFLRFPD